MKTVKNITIILSCLLAFCSCSKEVLVTSGKVLGERKVSADAGEFPVIVTTTGVWQVFSLSDWISVDEKLHKDQGSFVVKYESNTSYYGKTCFNRLGKVLVATYDGAQADTIIIKQRGLDPYLSFAPENVIASEGGSVSVAVQSNLGDSERKGLKFSSNASWISDISWGRDGKSLYFTAEPGTQERKAVVTVCFTPEWGESFFAECNITQK